MIRAWNERDAAAVMRIWLDTNCSAHSFIPKTYWLEHAQAVRRMLPLAEIYVHEDDRTKAVDGFIGLMDHDIAGIFVAQTAQSGGIGRQLLDHVKGFKSHLRLHVYQKNLRAQRFYQREQFRIAAETVDEETNEAEFVMVWENDAIGSNLEE